MKAALYANGRVVTGVCHGHAFSSLNEGEKDNCVSGFYDDVKKKFVSDGRFFYMKDITLIRHAHACNDQLTQKGIRQITASLKHLEAFWKPNLQILSSPSERCEHTAYFIKTHFACHGYVDDKLSENATEEQIIACMDEMPEHVIAVTHSQFIRKAIGMVTGTFLSYIPNFSVLRMSGSHLDDMAVFYEDDNS